MKTFIHKSAASSLLAAMNLLIVPEPKSADGGTMSRPLKELEQTRELMMQALAMQPPESDHGEQTTTALAYGAETNGIRGEIEIKISPNTSVLQQVVVCAAFVSESNAPPVFGEADSVDKISRNEWGYYMPTNSFCGPIEMSDAAGRRLSLLKPEVSALEAYPEAYSWRVEHADYFSRFQAYSGPGIFPLPLFVVSSRSELVRFEVGPMSSHGTYPAASLYRRWFRLDDYFELKEAGEYKLTVWPKIYRRSEKDRDLCERVDLPPVTVTIQWAGTASK